MFLPRATGVLLLLYGGFHVAIGLWAPQYAWLLTAVLLGVGGVALLAAQRWSRLVVYAAALAAAAVGLIGQVGAAGAAEADIPLSIVIWSLWTSLWLAVGYVGCRYLPDRDSAGTILPAPRVPGRVEPAGAAATADTAPSGS